MKQSSSRHIYMNERIFQASMERHFLLAKWCFYVWAEFHLKPMKIKFQTPMDSNDLIAATFGLERNTI